MGKNKGDGKIDFTDADYEKIETMAGYGLPLSKIAPLFGRSLRTFQNYKDSDERLQIALEAGKAKSHLNVAKTAYDLAVSGDCPQLTMFWLKTRAGWKETDAIEVKAQLNIESESLDKLVGSIASLVERTREVKDVQPIMLKAVSNDEEK